MSKQCSDIFDKVFDAHCGTCLMDCACGRTHFDSTTEGYSWEPGELARLEANADKDPDNYIAHDGTVGCMDINGQQVVYGCRCDIAQIFEKVILDNATRIANYLNLRAIRLREIAGKIEVKA
jgi:hypothetical protein